MPSPLWLVMQITSVAHFDAVGRGHPPHQILNPATLSLDRVRICGLVAVGNWVLHGVLLHGQPTDKPGRSQGQEIPPEAGACRAGIS